MLIEVQDHKVFERDGFDIHCEVPVSFSQAALGCEVDVPTLGGRVKVTLPEGTQSGKKMRLKGKGIVRLGSYGMGDQILTIHVETPNKLTDEQRKLFERLAETEKDCHPISRRFFLRRLKSFFNRGQLFFIEWLCIKPFP